MDNSLMEDEDFPPLPPPVSPGQGGRDDGDPFADGDEGEVSKLADVPAAKRKGVKRPQPKLDSQRLTSERGLPALRTLFENVRFKGKGHEAEDLQLLMQKMENWAHRLFPKLQFEDFISKVEKLGGKKDVQTCLKRIRLDMPLTHEDFMVKDGDEEAELETLRDPDPFSDLQGPIHSTPAPPPPPLHHSPAAPSLTEEQRRRIELNRQRALERRLARQKQETDSQTVLTSSTENESSSSTNVLNVSRDQDETQETNSGSSCTQPLSQLPPAHAESTEHAQTVSESTEHAQTVSESTEHAQTVSESTEHAQTASNAESTEHAQTVSNAEPTEHAQTVSNAEPTEHAQTVSNAEPTEHAQTISESTEHAQTVSESTEHAQSDTGVKLQLSDSDDGDETAVI